MPEEVDPRGIVKESDIKEGRVMIGNGLTGGTRMKGRLAGGVRDKLTMAEMKARISSLWKDGELYANIANIVSDEFGLEGDMRLKPNGIHYHIKEQIKYWKEAGLLSIDEKQALVLTRYDQLEALITEAYFASCEGKSTRIYEKQIDRARSKDREETIRDIIAEERASAKSQNRKMDTKFLGELPDTLMMTAEKVKENERLEGNSPGDPRWTAQLIDINDKRAKLWNLYAKMGEDNPDQELARLSDEARESRLTAVLTAMLARKTGNLGMLAEPSPLGGHAEGETPAEQLQAQPLVSPETIEEVREAEKQVIGNGANKDFMEGFED